VANVFQGKYFTWSRTPSKVAPARRENITVRLPGLWMKPKMQILHMMLFHFFISDDILNIILTNTNTKIHDYLNFIGNVQKWMRKTSLHELCAVIGLLIYGGVFEPSHEYRNIEH
jgi:hypothetical protein